MPVYAPPAITQLQRAATSCWASAPGVTRDTRDSYIFPTEGQRLRHRRRAGDRATTRSRSATAEFTQFFSSKYLAREDGSGKHVLGVRTQLAVAGTNAPVYERFYAGGIRSFRGFSFRGVGPFDDTNLALGGTFSFLNTIEYQIPMLPSDKLFGGVRGSRHGGAGTSRSRTTACRWAPGCGSRSRPSARCRWRWTSRCRSSAADDHRQLFNFSVGVFGSQ